MITKLKIALLALLGFSTAACCTTKKTESKSQEGDDRQIEADSLDTRIMLMYGVPFPDGSRVTPVDSEELQNRRQEIRSEEPSVDGDTLKISKGPALLPDGRAAAPLSDEEAARKVAEMEAKAAERAANEE